MLYREELAVAALARELRRPVRWREDRFENLTASTQAREDFCRPRAAVDAEGRLLALELEILEDFGAYCFYPGNYLARVVAMILTGPYKVQDYRYDVKVVLSNKVGNAPMRAPMAITSWVMEGTMEAIAREPQIMAAANPMYAVQLFVREPWTAFVALGSVVLSVTGCEALYADMGHFGAKAIRWAWMYFAFPALVLNYFGRGALLLANPHAAPFLFYALVPDWLHYPMVALATIATIIASQAVISGVFSITRQAVQLGQLPRMVIKHTSAEEMGQIYVPRINAMLCVGVVLIVLIFRSSDALAAAYGIAVTGVMVISTALVAIVARYRWKWKLPAVLAVFGVLGAIDIAFMSSNALKIFQGGWMPLAVAGGVFVIMDTWRLGRRVHLDKQRDNALALDLFMARADKFSQRIAGTAVFLSPRIDIVPNTLLHSLKHYHVLHERVVIATVTVADKPVVPPAKRVTVEKLGKGFFALRINYGFFETPDIPAAMELARAQGLALEPDATTYFLGRETLVAGHDAELKRWRVALYMWLSSNALAPARFYLLPPGRVVELGTQVTI